MVRAAYPRLNEGSRLRNESESDMSLRCTKSGLDGIDPCWSCCYCLNPDGVDGAIGEVIEDDGEDGGSERD